MTYLTIDEINSNPIYKPPASLVLPFLTELTGRFHFKRMNGIILFNEEKYIQLKGPVMRFYYNKFKKFVYVNLPTHKTHKGYGHKNSGLISNRFNDYYYNHFDSNDFYHNYYEDRRSLTKKELIEWAQINNLKIKKSMKINELVNIIRNMA